MRKRDGIPAARASGGSSTPYPKHMPRRSRLGIGGLDHDGRGHSVPYLELAHPLGHFRPGGSGLRCLATAPVPCGAARRAFRLRFPRYPGRHLHPLAHLGLSARQPAARLLYCQPSEHRRFNRRLRRMVHPFRAAMPYGNWPRSPNTSVHWLGNDAARVTGPPCSSASLVITLPIKCDMQLSRSASWPLPA